VAEAHSSSGDPARSIALLWRHPAAVPRRGPTRAWDLDAVVAAAISLADAGGLSAVTIRAVAHAVGAAPMSVYTYVPGKAELLDLMLDAAYAAMPRADTSTRPWPERVRAVAEENRALFADHPWAARVSTGRPPLGPGSIGKYEHELAAFDGLGLDDVDRDACLTHVVEFARAAALAAQDAQDARADGRDDAQWWAVAGPLLERVLDPAAYPRASRVGSAAGEAHGSAADPGHAYRFGLDLVLNGLAAFIAPVARGPAGRLDALDTEIRRGRRARGDPAADPASDPASGPAADPARHPVADPAAEHARLPAADPAADNTRHPAADPAADPARHPATHRPDRQGATHDHTRPDDRTA
jgi:AcrR family transcriptional regulator